MELGGRVVSRWQEAAWSIAAVAPIAASALVYTGFFADDDFLPVLLGAAIAAIPFAMLAGVRRYRADATLAIGIVAGLGYQCYGLFWPSLDYGLPGPRTVALVGSAVAHG